MTLEPQNKAWQSVLDRLPITIDLDTTARETGALRRKRAVRSADDLLRLILAYCVCGMSLRVAATWARCHELASLSDVATLKRIRNALPWLKLLLSMLIRERSSNKEVLPKGSYRLCLVDATYIKAAGKSGSTWRIHSRYRLKEGVIAEVEVTDVHGSERFDRFGWEEGDVAIADRGYSFGKQLHYLASQKACFVVRIGFRSCSLCNADGSIVDVVSAARATTAGRPSSCAVHIADHWKRKGAQVAARLIILKQHEGATKRATKQVYKMGHKKQSKPTAATFEMAQYLLLVTSLPEETFTAEQILHLYRTRWQIEMAFKRWKSLGCIDNLKAKDAVLVQCCIYAGLIAALLAEDVAREIEGELADLGNRSVSPWRLFAFVTAQLRVAVSGALTLSELVRAVTCCKQTICEPPRKRLLQSFTFRHLLI